ncbi:MAG TPA: SpoVG family protein [Candidatus Omnitrophota bacterium]|nr:SpoVG family protein [Candidatus Omnitrophota bacterium]HPD85640.1 SpoVG family protein [Candidatus Omnitrophota bacterium]HRZ04483.1 SpoVG family protein [Candidatus Omnitrophota bacterium]
MLEQTLSFKVARIYKLTTGGRIKAFVDMNVGDALVIRGLKIIEGPNGLFVSMPQEQGKDKKWYDTIRCMSDDVRAQITQCVLEGYESGAGA